MGDLAISVERREGRVTITLRGRFGAGLAAALRSEVRAVLAATPPPALVFDLCGITEHDAEGAAGLLGVHREIATAGPRSVYIVARPALRCLILKIIHTTQDQRTRPVATPAMAESWLAEASPQAFAEASYHQAQQLLERVRARLQGRGEVPS